ncbi:LysR family transcriptional regulator [Agrococcus jenensis]|uniref:LysR family transcriptional regulator n=1 Tax=Agrococcus jenensis TaxID=46353 RepID=A0A3N2AR57_9MICO|nr:LysR substrate-binding domain-containing protein [Agrococcus jenensis]ROR65192.1 LysR family transcriptional regulator [Agrococcus jenensis]
MYSLEQLRGFVAVSEHLHFGRAAESLQMTQPPLSRQIQKLEAELGVHLFTRTNRQVELTAAGVELLERARHILALADRSRAAVRSVAHGERGTLTIGFTATSALSVLGPLLDRIHDQLPDVDIDLRERVSGLQRTEIDRGSIDLGLLRTVPAGDYGVRELFREDLVLAVPDRHPLAEAGRPVSVDRLVEHPMIGYARPESEYFLRKVERILGDRQVRTVYSVAQILSMLSLVARSIGVALVPRSTESLRPHGVTFLELDLPGRVAAEAQVTIAAVWDRGSRNPVLPRALEAIAAPLQLG